MISTMELAVNRFSSSKKITKGDVLTIDMLLVDNDPVTTDINTEEKQKEDHRKFEEDIANVVKKSVPQFSKIRGVKDIEIIYFKDGITNKLACVSLKRDTDVKCLVRVYGSHTEYVIDRNHELIVLKEHPEAPVILGRFQNGYICTYTPGHAVNYSEASDPSIMALTAGAVGRLHAGEVSSIPHKPIIFDVIHSWLRNIPDTYPDETKQKFYEMTGKKDVLRAEVDWFEKEVYKTFGKEELMKEDVCCFCHNDLLFGNILYCERRKVVSLIDWEYSSYGFAPFDIANHFCEWAGFETEWEKFPSQEQQRFFIEKYLAERFEKEPTTEMVERWLNLVKWFDLCSNLYWGIWALLQAALSTIDFDYAGYSARRIKRYHEQKKKLLSNFEIRA